MFLRRKSLYNYQNGWIHSIYIQSVLGMYALVIKKLMVYLTCNQVPWFLLKYYKNIAPVSGIPEHQYNHQLTAEMGFLSPCVEADCEAVRDRCYEEHFKDTFPFLRTTWFFCISRTSLGSVPFTSALCKLCGAPACSPNQITQYPAFLLHLYFAVQAGVPVVTTLALNNI